MGAALDASAAQLESAAEEGERAEHDRRVAALADRLDEVDRRRPGGRRGARAEVADARREAGDLRRRLREAQADLGRARAAEAEARAAEAASVTAADAASVTGAAEVRRLRARLAEAEDALEAARRTAEGQPQRERRAPAPAAGHRRGRGPRPAPRAGPAPPPRAVRPTWSRRRRTQEVEAATGTAPGGAATCPPGRWHKDDPAVLDQLLALPQAHLVVDGYNVTKSGYGDLPLEEQRARLLSGLAALAARTGAEVTCVFDGATLEVPVPSAAPRGVRVLFSPAGRPPTSCRRLVRAEPPRPAGRGGLQRTARWPSGVARAGAVRSVGGPPAPAGPGLTQRSSARPARSPLRPAVGPSS